MKKSISYVLTGAMLLSALMLQACPPAQTTSPVASSTPVGGMESLKPVESPSASPSTVVAISPATQVSSSPSVIPMTTASPAFVGKTYKYDFVLKSGTATAYLTTLSATKGRLLINFAGIDAVPSKIALLDSFGNELALTTSFSVAKDGNVNFEYLLKEGQEMTDIVLYVNGVGYKVSIKNGVVYADTNPRIT